MTFGHRYACAPYALAYLFRESYDAVCRRIHDVGGQYTSVTSWALHAVLHARFPVLQFLAYPESKRPIFTDWRRRKRGAWLVVVTKAGYNGHCIYLRDGKARDNGWCAYTSPETLEVCGAWQVDTAGAVG